jgi:hypothetical protein
MEKDMAEMQLSHRGSNAPQAIHSPLHPPPSSIFAVRARKSLPFGLLSGTSGSARAVACCVLGAGRTWVNSVKTKVSW